MHLSPTDQPTNCKNCNTEHSQKYCPNCGHPAQLKRIDGHYLAHEIEHLLHLEKGILFTIKALLLDPGKEIRTYISENRSKLVKPVIFIIVTSLVYSIISHFFHIEELVPNNVETKQSATLAIFQWVQEHYGYANIIMGVFIALWIKLIFRKYGYNLFEILVLLCFTMGMGMLIFALFALLQGLLKIELMQVGSIVAYVYCARAIAQFFDKKNLMNYLKALLAYILGMITFFILVIALGNAVDMLNFKF
jgi:hypothetical protein